MNRGTPSLRRSTAATTTTATSSRPQAATAREQEQATELRREKQRKQRQQAPAEQQQEERGEGENNEEIVLPASPIIGSSSVLASPSANRHSIANSPPFDDEDFGGEAHMDDDHNDLGEGVGVSDEAAMMEDHELPKMPAKVLFHDDDEDMNGNRAEEEEEEEEEARGGVLHELERSRQIEAHFERESRSMQSNHAPSLVASSSASVTVLDTSRQVMRTPSAQNKALRTQQAIDADIVDHRPSQPEQPQQRQPPVIGDVDGGSSTTASGLLSVSLQPRIMTDKKKKQKGTTAKLVLSDSEDDEVLRRHLMRQPREKKTARKRIAWNLSPSEEQEEETEQEEHRPVERAQEQRRDVQQREEATTRASTRAKRPATTTATAPTVVERERVANVSTAHHKRKRSDDVDRRPMPTEEELHDVPPPVKRSRRDKQQELQVPATRDQEPQRQQRLQQPELTTTMPRLTSAQIRTLNRIQRETKQNMVVVLHALYVCSGRIDKSMEYINNAPSSDGRQLFGVWTPEQDATLLSTRATKRMALARENLLRAKGATECEHRIRFLSTDVSE